MRQYGLTSFWITGCFVTVLAGCAGDSPKTTSDTLTSTGVVKSEERVIAQAEGGKEQVPAGEIQERAVVGDPSRILQLPGIGIPSNYIPRIAYERQDYSANPSVSRALYVMNSDGTGKIQIPLYGGGGTVTRIHPALEPGGTRIAFASNPTHGALDIFTMNLDGSGLVRLTQDGGNSQPAWSRDRNRIAFRHEGNNPGIHIMNPDGSGRYYVSAIAQPGAMWPAWSPDGKSLLYSVSHAVSGAIYLYNMVSNTNKWLVASGQWGPAYPFRPAWSPDGSKVAFTDPGYGISVVNADGTGLVSLTSQARTVNVSDRKPSWSPDGQKIMFERHDEKVGTDGYGITNIFVVDTIGGIPSSQSVRQVTTGPYNGAPSWALINSPVVAPALTPPTKAPPTIAP